MRFCALKSLSTLIIAPSRRHANIQKHPNPLPKQTNKQTNKHMPNRFYNQLLPKLENADEECFVVSESRHSRSTGAWRNRRATDEQLECLTYFLKQPPYPVRDEFKIEIHAECSPAFPKVAKVQE
jgi:hypothetical protein